MISNFHSFPTIDLNEQDDADKVAIQVQNVTFSYTKTNPVLKNFSVKIGQGGIFSLLGSNGCGKTTLLKLILGQIKAKKGWIRVYGLKPGHKKSDIPGKGVGYMPQDIALLDKLTIKECLHYFGRIYDMSPTLIDHRIAILIELLYLPPMDKFICELSGGQKRLVSLAVTIIHKPKLMILDEPTVGVDSIVRCRIWSYLESIAKNYGTTIIITTHYIEEAKNANQVGFICTGQLLKQANPIQLLNEYNCETLEDVFLILCQEHYRQLRENKRYGKSDDEKESESDKIPITDNNVIAVNRIQALITKNMIRLRRNTFTLVMYFLMPLITVAIFRRSVGTIPRNVPIGIYSQNDTNTTHLVKKVVAEFDPDLVKFEFFSDKESAIRAVETGKNMYAFIFPVNYSESILERMPDPFDVSDYVMNHSIIRIYADHSNSISAIFVKYTYILDCVLSYITKLGAEMDLNPMAFSLPINRSNPVFGGSFHEAEKYPATGILLCVIFLLAIAMSSMVIINEMSNKSLERVYVSGVKPIEVFLVHMLEMGALIALQELVCLLLFYYLFAIPLDMRFVQVFLLIYLHGIEGAGIGLMIALLFKNAIHVFIIILGIIIPLLTCSGVIWPSEAIPPMARYITDWSPITQPLESLRSLLFRGLDISHPRVLIGYIISLVYNGLIYGANILLVTQWKDFDISHVIPQFAQTKCF